MNRNRNRNRNGAGENGGSDLGHRHDAERPPASDGKLEDQNDRGEHEDTQGTSKDLGSKKSEKSTTKEQRLAGPKPLPRLSTSLGSQFTLVDNPASSVLPRAPTFNNGSGSFVDTMTQQLTIHVEQPVGSMSISPTSRDVVLAA